MNSVIKLMDQLAGVGLCPEEPFPDVKHML